MRFLKLRNKTFLNVSNLEVAKCDQNAAFRALVIHPNSVLHSAKIQIIFYYRALKTSEMDSSGCVDITRYSFCRLTPSGPWDTIAQSWSWRDHFDENWRETTHPPYETDSILISELPRVPTELPQTSLKESWSQPRFWAQIWSLLEERSSRKSPQKPSGPFF